MPNPVHNRMGVTGFLALNAPAASTSVKKSSFSQEDQRVLTNFQNNFSAKLRKVVQSRAAASDSKAALDDRTVATACVLDTLFEGYKSQGIHLRAPAAIPDNIDEMMQEAVQRIQNSDAMNELPDANLYATNIKPKVKETLDKHYNGFANHGQFSKIAPENRKNMCIDPEKLEDLRSLLEQKDENPLAPFAFDSEAGYLHNMTKAWELVMSPEFLKKPFNVERIFEIYDTCFPRGYKTKNFDNVSTGFGMTEGFDLSEKGKLRLKALAEEIREHLPTYSIELEKEEGLSKLFEYGGTLESIPEKLSAIDISDKSHIWVSRPAASNETLGKLADKWISEFKDIEKVERHHCIDICQKMCCTHFFRDANCRAFTILLLNHLLARADQPLSMFRNPEILCGYSLEETDKEAEVGQQDVASWCQSTDTSSKAGIKPTAMQSRLLASMSDDE